MENTNYAGFWWRFLASFIDGIILQLAGCILGIALGLLLGVILLSMGGNANTVKILSQMMGWVLGIILQWLYFALFEASELQATPGKLVCSIKVTDDQGQRLSFARATGRSFAKYVSAFTCLVGYIMAAFTERRQALHDMIASTLVVTNSGLMGEIPPESSQ